MPGRVRINNLGGYTMLELLLAMFLGSIVFLGTSGLFAEASSFTAKHRREFGQVQAVNLLLGYLRDEVQLAGFSPLDGPVIDESLLVMGHQGPGLSSDSIIVRYHASVSEGRDCLGGTDSVDADGIVTNRFWLDDGELKCNGQALVQGLAAMQLALGIDEDGDGLADGYVDGAQEPCASCAVVAVRVNLVAGGHVLPEALAGADVLLEDPAFYRDFGDVLEEQRFVLYRQTFPLYNR